MYLLLEYMETIKEIGLMKTQLLKVKNELANRNRIKAETSWSIFCKKNHIILNIVRLGGIYGLRPDLSKTYIKI